jgi:hypothetical protein
MPNTDTQVAPEVSLRVIQDLRRANDTQRAEHEQTLRVLGRSIAEWRDVADHKLTELVETLGVLRAVVDTRTRTASYVAKLGDTDDAGATERLAGLCAAEDEAQERARALLFRHGIALPVPECMCAEMNCDWAGAVPAIAKCPKCGSNQLRRYGALRS